MPLATYQDLCIDVSDARLEGEFYAGLLGLRLVMHDDGDAHLDGDVPSDRIWLNVVPETQTVKNRVHLDLNIESVDRALEAGATVLWDMGRWTTLTDPEGQEFCVFPREGEIVKRAYELEWDCAEGPEPARRQAEWWGAVLGATPVHDEEKGYSYLQDIPGCPWDFFDFVGVPEPKQAKNRVHIDVATDDLDALLAHGATVLRAKGDDGLRWNVLADPDGNEFCAFTAD
jgi:catechol 2,3-dioxygenase-like lactoylglutathione lyase family enzyme